MSTTSLANLAFTADYSVRINMSNTNNLTISTANAVANTFRSYTSGMAANIYYDSSNTAFYFAPASNTVLNYSKVNNLGLSRTGASSESGLGCYAIRSGRRVFNCAAGGTWAVYTGRGASATWSLESVDHLTHFNNPAETTEPINFGMYYKVCFALYANGNLYTWGLNDQGQCGLGSISAVAVPTLAATNVTNVYEHGTMNSYSGSSKLIIKKADGMLYAAGYNGNGQLGVGDATNRSSFTMIPNSFNPRSVWNLGAEAGALVIQTQDYRILVCGYNAYGQLGNGNLTNQNYLVDVTSNWGGGTGKLLRKVVCGLGFVDSAANPASYMGMLLDDGTNTYLRMAGNNSWGSIGNGTLGNVNYSTPIIPSIPTSVRIADVSGFGGGPGTVMVLYENGNLYNWGYGDFGQLGRGAASSSGVPALVTTGVEKIFCDGHDSASYPYRTAAFYRKNGLLYGTGYNEHGQLGQGNVTTPYTSWTLMKLPSDFVCDSIATASTTGAGRSYVFFGTDGRMFMTGYNAHNMLTWESTTNVISPIEVRPPLGG